MDISSTPVSSAGERLFKIYKCDACPKVYYLNGKRVGKRCPGCPIWVNRKGERRSIIDAQAAVSSRSN